MKFKLLALASVALILAGCASTPVPLSQAKPIDPARALAFQEPIAGESAKLVAIRDEAFQGGGCYLAFWIGGELAARLDVAEAATFNLRPGEYRLKVSPDPQGRGMCSMGHDYHWTQRETVLRPGERKVFRLTIGDNGKLDVERAD